MADTPITSRNRRAFNVRFIFDHYAGTLTAGTNKQEWIVPFDCYILDVIVDAETAGVGAGSSTIDVNRNGTTIYTTQANRPTIATADTGMFAEAGEPEIRRLVAGDVLSYDVDAIPATTGHARTKVAILVGMP